MLPEVVQPLGVGSSGRKPSHWGSDLGEIFRPSAPPCLHLSLLPGWAKWAALFQHSGPLLTHRVTMQQVTNDARRSPNCETK